MRPFFQRFGVGVMTVAVAICGASISLAAPAMADPAHTIDWYVAHPGAMRNAAITCNIQNGTSGTQACRNAYVAMQIYERMPGKKAAASSSN